MLSLRKYSLKDNRWFKDPVLYRNTLLGQMFPGLDIVIGDVSNILSVLDDDKKPDLQGAIAAMDAGFEGYRLDGASGSRKKGQAFFTRNGDIFQRFFGSPANCINYGSNLVTECRSMCEMTITLLVVPDGEFKTGDCHGKCSSKFALGVVGQLQRPFQFRAAVNDSSPWVAKGTLAFSFDTGGYDLVLPESCFKGNKVTPGIYNLPNLHFGVVHEAKVRKANMSYSVTQYLPWKAVEADILPGTLTQAHKLAHLQNNTRALADLVLPDLNEEDEEDAVRYVSPVAEVIAADVHGQLLEHPYVVRYVRELLRKRWLRLATAGATQFDSMMTMPDDSIPDGFCCIPHLPEGDVIIFPYPCRWKWDIKIWKNRHFKAWDGYEGIIVGNTATMLSVGRDFDGDFLQALSVDVLPTVAAAIRAFGPTPAITKPAKEKVTGTKPEIAGRSMDNCVGLITYAIAKAWAVGWHGYIPRLAQELQIEVDSLKNVQRADRNFVSSVLMDMKSAKVAWLSDHKDTNVFRTRELACVGNDTISRLAAAVNAVWEPCTMPERTLIEFRDVFPEAPESWRIRAATRRNEHLSAISAASRSGDNHALKSVIAGIKAIGDSIPADKKAMAAAAFWHTYHVQKSGTASAVFHAFIDQIRIQLAASPSNKLTIVGSSYGDFADVSWVGEQSTIVIAECKDVRFSDRLEARIGEQRLGLLAADSTKLPVGTELAVTLTTVKGTVVALSAA